MAYLIILAMLALVLGGLGIAAFICDVIIAKFPETEKIIDRVIEKL